MKSLFDLICGSGFMPHGQCYLWTPALVWLHAVSDSLIALAYFSIPLALLHVVRRRRDVPYPALFLMFGGFIVACGATHALEVWTIWNGSYYLTGGVKALTAAISLVTAVTLVRVIPQALQLTGPADLQRVNQSLEEHVRSRTTDLENANASLRREVGERERAEAEVTRLNRLLQRRVDELQALFNVMPVGIGIAEDPACRVIRTNDAFARMLGLPRQANASLSAPAPDAPVNFTVYHQDRRLTPQDLPMQTCARLNQPVVDFQETIVHRDGGRLEVLVNAVPLRDSEGHASGCVATFQDVTPLQTALATSARLAAIVASSEDAIVGQTLDGVVTDWNHAAEKILGYRAAEMIGQPGTRLLPAERAEEETELLARLRRGDTIHPFETTRRHQAGHLVPVSIIISPIRGAAEQIVGVSVSARDISERKQAEAHRREMDRKIQETQKLESLGVLAGGIAHDFNNLLTGILGNVSLARAEASPSSDLATYLSQIDLASRRAADLCKQMLAYSGRSRFVVQRLDLNHLVTDLTHLLSISISKTSALRLDLAPALPAVAADATQIRQIVMNLVINASEAIGPRNGVIVVRTGVARLTAADLFGLRHGSDLTPGDYVGLEISDDGSGMDAATLEKIFDPFFTTKFTGRGLGLAAVLGIVRGHKGGLSVTSESGRGTTFKLFLPGVDGAADAVPARLDPAAARGRDSGHVLVVDDEETVRDVATRALAVLGYSAETAPDGIAAVERFRAHPARFRVVLLDLTMPRLGGEDTFRQLRELNPDVRVVLMSGFTEHEAVSRFTGQGLAGFLQKPFDLASLAAALRAVTSPG